MTDKNSKIKGIFSIDAYEKKYYLLKNQQVKPAKKLQFDNTNFVATYISNKDIITAPVEVSRSIPNEDIEGIIEIKAYEEFGLDQAIEYDIKYFERDNSDDNRIFDIVITEMETIEETFADIVFETKFIDLIVPAPLLYHAVYDREILKDAGVHCFIYFTQEDTFITFYKNGHFLYSKSIQYSLERIYDKYCELVGERVDEAEFFKILESEGLKTIHSDYQQNLMKLFGDIFISINDIVIYAKRAFDLDTIDQMFIGSSRGPIVGLDEYSENYLGLLSTELNFNFNLENDEWYIDQLQMMLMVVSSHYMEDMESAINFTIFERPPPFYKRTSGQFIIATALSITVGISYPLIYLVGSYMNDATNIVLTAQEQQLTQEAEKYKQIIGKKKEEISKLDAIVKKKSLEYYGKEQTLTSIYDKKVNYRLKSEVLYAFSKDIKKFDVSTNIISSDNDKYVFHLLSRDDKEITRLIQHLSDKYYNEIESIDIAMIEKSEKTAGYYTGTLEITLKPDPKSKSQTQEEAKK